MTVALSLGFGSWCEENSVINKRFVTPDLPIFGPVVLYCTC